VGLLAHHCTHDLQHIRSPTDILLRKFADDACEANGPPEPDSAACPAKKFGGATISSLIDAIEDDTYIPALSPYLEQPTRLTLPKAG
jgi:hypothetical protein